MLLSYHYLGNYRTRIHKFSYNITVNSIFLKVFFGEKVSKCVVPISALLQSFLQLGLYLQQLL